MYCYHKKIMPIDEANISISDLGVLRGYGVFDLAYARGAKIFYGREHLERFRNSAKIMNIAFPYELRELEQNSLNLLEKNQFAESTVRWVLTGGMESDG